MARRNDRQGEVTRLLGELFGESEHHPEVARQMLEAWSSSQSCVTSVLHVLKYYRDRGWEPTTQEEYDRRQAEWDEARRQAALRDQAVRIPPTRCGTEGFST